MPTNKPAPATEPKKSEAPAKATDPKTTPAAAPKKPEAPAKATDPKTTPAAASKKPEAPAKAADLKAAPAAEPKKPEAPAKAADLKTAPATEPKKPEAPAKDTDSKIAPAAEPKTAAVPSKTADGPKGVAVTQVFADRLSYPSKEDLASLPIPKEGEGFSMRLHPAYFFQFLDHPFSINREVKDYRDLFESIKENGINEPIKARPREGGGLELLSGHRRHDVAMQLNYPVPVVIVQADDDTARIEVVDGNLHRQDIPTSFIRFPFVVEGFLLGMFGAAMAFFLEWGLYNALVSWIGKVDALNLLQFVPFAELLWPMMGTFGAAGLFVGIFGSFTSIRRFLDV